MNERTPGPGTLSVWAGEEEPGDGGGTQVPIVRSVAFGYRDIVQWQAVGRGEAPGDIYMLVIVMLVVLLQFFT